MDANHIKRIAVSASPINSTIPNTPPSGIWTGLTVINALKTTTTNFASFVPAINAMNVFPVPDGDAGTNMHLTLNAAIREIEKLGDHPQLRADEVMSTAARGALMGARGNSGVILYQIMAGLTEATQGLSDLNGQALATGLRRASDLAYQAVVKPVEGTMLTVIREAADAAEIAAQRDPTITGVLEAALAASQDALNRTPELLDILRQAGVVDAGGQGLVILLDGLHRFAQGEPVQTASVTAGQSAGLDAYPLEQTTPNMDHGEEAFGYCVNFTVTSDRISMDEFRARMNNLGESAVLVGDERMVKVHIHAERPGLVLEAALEYGELHEVRIDNMDAQTREIRANRDRQRTDDNRRASTEPDTRVAIVAVATGDGIIAALKSMGATEIVRGGPTFNPSTEDILEIVDRVPQDEVILLPNDANVIATARHVDKLTSKIVQVVPSISIPEGISALSAFNIDAELSQNSEAMSEAVGYVTTLTLTRASRDAEINGVRADTGQYIGLIGGDLRAAGDDPNDVVMGLLSQVDTADAELITLFTGEPAQPGLGKRLATQIEEIYPDVTVEVLEGGQPHYELIISLE